MSAPAKPVGRLEGKIGLWHRDRLAVVYVRQPTAAQVADHGESTRLQYGLAGRDQPWAGRDQPWAGRDQPWAGRDLPWAGRRRGVLVIDGDLGHSASEADARPGFQRLVSEVGWIMWASRCPGWPAAAGSGISCWVRHEALCIRVEMEGRHRRAVAAVWRSWRQPDPGIAGGREQPRQRRDGPVPPDGPVPASKVRRRNSSESVVEAP